MLGPSGNGRSSATAALIREAMDRYPDHPRAVLVCDAGAGAPRVEEEQSLPVLFCKLSDSASEPAQPKGVSDAYQTIFGVMNKIGARACAVIASEFQQLTPQFLDRLFWPVLGMDFDLVAPRYTRGRWEGLINRSILSPLTRALYGKHIHNPLGPDFGFSTKLMRAILRQGASTRNGSAVSPVASIVSAAVGLGLQICETEMGIRHRPPTDWGNLSALLTQILGPVFLDMEINAPIWQRVRGSSMVPTFGTLEQAPSQGTVDTGRLMDSFQLGAANLQDVWSLVLPPKTVLEIRKISRLPPQQFRIPDDLWVGIVYDFALAHRLRTINRDHLLRSFTPLYLGWIASYALEVSNAEQTVVERRLEQLALAYEAGKVYLLSRWRWPDRFNP